MQVEYSEHEFIDGEEICKCTFTILWLHGPMVGQKTSTGIERICLHQPLSSQMDPALDHFLHKSKLRFEQQIKQRDQRTENLGILPEVGDFSVCVLVCMAHMILSGGNHLQNN